MRQTVTVAVLAAALGAAGVAGCGSEDGTAAGTGAGPASVPLAGEEGSGGGTGEAGAREVDEPAPRLVVADGRRGRIAVLDLASGKRLARLFVPAAGAGLSVAPDGRHALAVQSDADRVDVVDAGSWTVPHGDHAHAFVRAPRKLAPFTGRKPVHVVGHGEEVAIFTDGDGAAHVTDVHALAEGAAPGRTVASGGPHHGVAVPLPNGRTLVSSPGKTAEDLPIGVALHDRDGNALQRFADCPDLHGEYADERLVAFACADGVLVLEGDGELRARKIPLPPGATAERRPFSLWGAPGRGVLLGDFGPRALLRVDLRRDRTTAIRLGAPLGTATVDPRTGRGAAITADGRVRVIDVGRGRVAGVVRAVGPYSLDGPWTRPRPQLAAGPDARLYVSEPATGRVVEVATNDARVTRRLTVGGTPFHLTVTGLPAAPRG